MKVLIISHNCFSTYNNMGITLCSLFSQFRKEELCQLYIYPSLPDVDICGSYYRITDKDILRSGVFLKAPGGPVNTEHLKFGGGAAFEHARDAAVYRRKGNADPAVRILRDALWSASRWYSPQLRRWIGQEKPTCIFLAPGYAKFIYDVAMKISEDFALPIVTYICDDYYFLKEPETVLGRMQLSALQKKTDRLMAKTRHLVAICQEIRGCYTRRFGVEASVIMTGAAMERQSVDPRKDGPVVISYLGNIRNNRSVTLAEIGRTLADIARESGTHCVLDVYTSEKDPQILARLEGCETIRLHDFVSGQALGQVFRNSDLLLHTEAFDAENVDLVKHSVSTKIAESLASGVPLIAYGPEEIASMGHLIRNQCAFTATSARELRPMLERALFDPGAREAILERATETAEKFHNQENNGALLYQLLQNL